MPRADRRHLRRLYWEQMAGWAVAWLLGIAALISVTVATHDRLNREDLDAELRLLAIAVYGLSWFDMEGTFHDGPLMREPELFEGPFDVWIIGLDGVHHLAPEAPRFQLSDLPDRAARLLRLEPDDFFRTGQDERGKPYRLHGIVTYDDSDAPRAAILVLGDPSSWRASHARFVRDISVVVALLVIVGLGIGMWLSKRAMVPVLTSLEQQERFLAAAAHELRTPIAGLRAVSESVNEGDEAEALGRMSRLVHRAGRLVDELLLYARLEAQSSGDPERTPVRLDLLVESVLPEDGSVALEATESIVSGEAGLLETAVRNLVSNALVHGAADRGDPSTAEVRVTVSGGQVVVEDRGPGFSDQELERSLEAFVSRPDSPGTGLGLAIVSQIAERHGGRLRLANRPSGGARVSFSCSQVISPS